jgi:hypothetical protein
MRQHRHPNLRAVGVRWPRRARITISMGSRKPSRQDIIKTLATRPPAPRHRARDTACGGYHPLKGAYSMRPNLALGGPRLGRGSGVRPRASFAHRRRAGILMIRAPPPPLAQDWRVSTTAYPAVTLSGRGIKSQLATMIACRRDAMASGAPHGQPLPGVRPHSAPVVRPGGPPRWSAQSLPKARPESPQNPPRNSIRLEFLHSLGKSSRCDLDLHRAPTHGADCGRPHRTARPPEWRMGAALTRAAGMRRCRADEFQAPRFAF